MDGWGVQNQSNIAQTKTARGPKWNVVPPARNVSGKRHLSLSNTGSKVVSLLYEVWSEEGHSCVYRELDALWIINVPDNDNVSQTICNTGIFLYREEEGFVFYLHFCPKLSFL